MNKIIDVLHVSVLLEGKLFLLFLNIYVTFSSHGVLQPHDGNAAF